MASKVSIINLISPTNRMAFESIPPEQFFLGRIGTTRKLYFKGSVSATWTPISIFEGNGVQTLMYPASSTVTYEEYEPVDVDITLRPRSK